MQHCALDFCPGKRARCWSLVLDFFPEFTDKGEVERAQLNIVMIVKTPIQIISRKYSIHGYPFEIRLVWGNAICFSILHRNEYLLKLIVFSYLKNFDDQTKHRFINQENYKFVTIDFRVLVTKVLVTKIWVTKL